VQGASFQGWTLLEALERTADPALWQACAAAKSEWERVRTPIPSGPSAFFNHSPEKIVALLHKYREVDSLLHSHFRRLLVDKKLIAYGSRNGPSETPTPIHAAGWEHLAWPKRENSTVKERYGARTKIYNVRAFPVLHSSEAPMLLNGLGLGEAFRKYIIEDPEIVAVGKLVGSQGGNQAVFEKGNAPGPYVSFHWPLGLSAKDLAWEFIRPIIHFVSSPLPEPSPEISKASMALADRCQALQRLLVNGQIGAVGTFAQTGETRPIDRMQWQRAGITVEIRNSDLCEPENHRPAVRWSGISLELPRHTSSLMPARDNTIAVNAVAVNSLTEAKRITPVQASIAEAVKALWPDGPPQSLQLQQRDDQIIEWQRKNKRKVVSQKSIRRYLSADGQLY
jgi:hypothetical protein